jgi:glycine/D-amino acid oxidase-like deaminating enzyme
MTPSARLDSAAPTPFWLDDPDRPAAREPHRGVRQADLVVVGGGFTGLWAALRALERDPGRHVVLLEGDRLASSASGRNGGFCVASLTHGDANGRARWPDEMPTLRRLGDENFAELLATIERHGIDCDVERTGELTLAVAPWQAADLAEESATLTAEGVAHTLLDEHDIRAEIDSPLALAGILEEDGAAMLNPARLAWGLATAIEAAGGIVHEACPVTTLERRGASIVVTTPHGTIAARQVVVATAAFRPLVRRTAGRVVPVYDYVLMTEPLNEPQLASIGWQHRRGIGDAGNQFHYLRLTADDRILFGGYEAVYRFNQKVDARFDVDEDVFATLADHFDAMFPTLADVGFTHRWGGAIDTSTRFAASATLSHGGKVATVNGFTGLGVGASRFFASTALDLLDGWETEATGLAMIRRGPVPFPPEPVRFLGIEATRRAIATADANDGRRGAWLRLLDRLGLGFDS